MTAVTVQGTTAAAARRTSLFLWLAVAAIIGAATLGGFYFTVGGVFGPLSDAAGGSMGVTVILAAVALRQLMVSRRIAAARVSWVIAWVAGVLTIASSVGLIVSSAVGLSWGGAFLVVQFLGMAGLGAWVLTSSITARELFRRRTVATGVISGVCYLLVGLVEPITGFTQALTFTVGSLGIVSFVVWVVFATNDLRRIRE